MATGGEDPYAGVSAWYPDAVRRAGATYPVAVRGLAGRLDGVFTVVEEPAPLDGELVALGARHLARLRAAHPRMFDGPVQRFLDVVDGRLRVTAGRYFDTMATCDALRAEWENAAADPQPDDVDHLPLRERAHVAAGGDPLVSGAGRAAAIGISVVLTRPGAPGRGCEVVLGLRGADTSADVGLWHVAPSGMVEPLDGGADLSTTVATELAEELGLHLDVAAVRERARVLGIVHDLLRLRPDVVVHLDLTADEGHLLTPTTEFEQLAGVDVTSLGEAGFWREWPPSRLTPPAAGALVLLASSGQSPAWRR